jgi:hypothetical protein
MPQVDNKCENKFDIQWCKNMLEKEINRYENPPVFTKLDSINSVFTLPIKYNEHVKKLNDNIVTDLELVKSINPDETPIYNYIFKPTNSLGTKVLEEVPKHYTTDMEYLKETQTLIKNFNSTKYKAMSDLKIEETIKTWEEIKGETGFHSKYLYFDWAFGEFINNNPQLLQIMSMYNIASPLFSLCMPIFVLIIPFFIIKIKGIELNVKEYIDVIKSLAEKHAIVKVFTNFNEVDSTQRIYLLVSAAFYLFSIYQNILTCIRFYTNMKKIHDYIHTFKEYLEYTIESMKYHLECSKELTKYSKFNEHMNQKVAILTKFKNEIERITPFNLSISKIAQIGHVMWSFYQLYNNSDYHDAMLYSFGFNGYMNLITGVKENLDTNKINSVTLVKGQTKPVFKQMYYPKFINESKIVKNNCDLSKNMVITGPNASGKTTTLKTVLINIILSQHIGFGCYDKCKLEPFENIHCYLNIPDTSGRDSLFQAEARRCKEIIDCIEEKAVNNERHFAIFDEIYSGTNPEEAVISAKAFMDFIVKSDNVTCLLTTHYMKLCKKLEKNKKIVNYNMKTITASDETTSANNTNNTNNNFNYTYELVKGISNIKGGLKVLSDMDYPKEILDNTSKCF